MDQQDASFSDRFQLVAQRMLLLLDNIKGKHAINVEAAYVAFELSEKRKKIHKLDELGKEARQLAELNTIQRVMMEFLSAKVMDLKGVVGFDTLLKTWRQGNEYSMIDRHFLVDVVTSFQAAVQMRFITLQDQLRHDVKSPSETVINCEDIIAETYEQLSLRSNLNQTIPSLREWQQLLSSVNIVLGVLIAPVKEKYLETLPNKQKEYAQEVFEMTVKQGDDATCFSTTTGGLPRRKHCGVHLRSSVKMPPGTG